jgi:hypothetical protein
MKIARRICIVVIAVGALMLAVPRDLSFDTVPFPAAGLSVKILADIAHDGDYHLVAAIPKVGEQLALSEESVPCALAVTLTRQGHPPTTNQITSISRYAEVGFGRIQYYKSTDWHLARGEHEISIAAVKDCPAATSRGATVSIEQSASHVTERFLAGVLRYWSGVVLLCVGLLGLIFCEFGRANKSLHATAAAPEQLTGT